MVRRPLVIALCAAGSLPACEPTLTDSTATIAAPRVLAIQSVPAEAAPGASVTLHALVAVPDDETKVPAPAWAFCLDRLPLTDLSSVAPSCVGTSGSLVALGSSLDVTGVLPMDACRLFGPDPPDPINGEPPGRPVDPDVTGGYFQPIRASIGADVAVSGTRLVCGLSNARTEDAMVFNGHYRNNQNPTVQSLQVGGLTHPSAVAPGAHVALTVTWPACPRSPACGDGVCSPEETVDSCAADCTEMTGCGGEETYLYYDEVGLRIAVRREGMRAAWFATSGAFDADRTGNAETDPEVTTLEDGWTAPAATGTARLWVVLRDDRGGVGWATTQVTVR